MVLFKVASFNQNDLKQGAQFIAQLQSELALAKMSVPIKDVADPTIFKRQVDATILRVNLVKDATRHEGSP